MNFTTALKTMLDPREKGLLPTVFRAVSIAFVAAGVAAAVLSTEAPVFERYDGALFSIILACGLFFSFEWLARLHVAPLMHVSEDASPGQIRRDWLLSAEGVADSLAVFPLLIAMLIQPDHHVDEVIGIIWITKLVRFMPGLVLVLRVIRHEREALGATLLGLLIVLLVAATLEHILEGEAQPKAFGSVSLSLWWTVVTLTTTGYGDVTPVTGPGRVLAGLVMISGICVFAMLAGILANGFSQEVRRREFLRTYDLVAKVPFFRDVGAATIAEVAKLLKPREVPRGALLFRRGQEGDCMYFVVSGALEVRTGSANFKIQAGNFLGEIALVTGGPRTATAVATAASTLLVLDIADFRELMMSRPELTTAIEAEAQKRLAVTRAPAKGAA